MKRLWKWHFIQLTVNLTHSCEEKQHTFYYIQTVIGRIWLTVFFWAGIFLLLGSLMRSKMLSPGLVRERQGFCSWNTDLSFHWIMMNPASGLIMPIWAEIFAVLWIKYGHNFKQSASEYAGMQQMLTFKVSPFPVTKCKQQQSDQVGNQ